MHNVPVYTLISFNTCTLFPSIIIGTQSAVQLAGITLWADFLLNDSLHIACSSKPHNHISFDPAFYISCSPGLSLSLYSHFCSFYPTHHALLYRLNNPIDIGRRFWKLQCRIVDAQALEACLIISAVIVGNCGAVGLRSPHLLFAGCITGREKILCTTMWNWIFLLPSCIGEFWFIFRIHTECMVELKMCNSNRTEIIAILLFYISIQDYTTLTTQQVISLMLTFPNHVKRPKRLSVLVIVGY